jgi:Membrane transporters of cations and cationic drugs
MHWIILFGAGLLEIVWAYFMKRSDGDPKTFAC